MRFSIKNKIILWYTIFFAVLMIANIIIVNQYASQIVESVNEHEIIEVSEDAIKDLVITATGPVYIDDDDTETFLYVDKEVIFTINDGTTVIYGSKPSNLTTILDISYYDVQSVDDQTGTTWLIYDQHIDDTYTLRSYYDISSQTAIYQSIINLIMIISPIIIVLSSIGGFFILKRSFKPIRDIHETAKNITTKQDYNLRVPYKDTKDEIANLASMINQMLDQIQTSIVREQDFTSNVSHELRTPLSVLRAQIEYLESKNKNQSLEKDLTDILEQLTFTEKLVEQLLELSRTKHIKNLDYETFAIDDQITHVIKAHEIKLKEKNITLTYTKTPLLLTTNQPFFIRILHNLLTNAIKYNKPNGTVNIIVEAQTKSIDIIITDTGIGMSKTTLSRIFDPFYRADTSRSQNDLSLGIGLTMTLEMMTLLDAQMDVQSTINQGTSITLSFKK